MKQLTDRQRTVLEFLVSYLAANGYGPSLREIGAALGITSTNGVSEHLHALERKGAIHRSMMKSRSVVVCDSRCPICTVNGAFALGLKPICISEMRQCSPVPLYMAAGIAS